MEAGVPKAFQRTAAESPATADFCAAVGEATPRASRSPSPAVTCSSDFGAQPGRGDGRRPGQLAEAGDQDGRGGDAEEPNGRAGHGASRAGVDRWVEERCCSTNAGTRVGVTDGSSSWFVGSFQASALAFSRASHPTIHRPSRPARAAAPARGPGDQPALVVAPRDPGRLRGHRRRAVDRERSRPGQDPRRRVDRPARGAGRRQALPAPPRAGARRPRAVPHRRPLVPEEGRRRRTQGDRLLLARVRHHLGAAAVLRRPRHPGRRPPQDRERPRRPADRRRAALPARLLPPAVLPRGLAAGDLPGARPRRAADHAASRGRRNPRAGAPVGARRGRPGRADLRGPGGPGAAAAARHRHRGQPPAAARGDRPAVRRHHRAPAAPGAAPRRRRRPCACGRSRA